MVEAFKLLQLSITKYMTPNLALLVDRTSDCSLNQLGPLLKTKLLDDDWEIRNSSLEVLAKVIELSYISTLHFHDVSRVKTSFLEFPSFRDVILQENFPDLILKLAEEDSEGFVRASALKCLREMVKTTYFLKYFSDHNIPVRQRVSSAV